MAFLAPVLGAASSGAGAVGSAASTAAGAVGTAGKAVGSTIGKGFSSLIGGGGDQATGSLGGSAPAAAGGSIANAAGNVGQDVFGPPMPDVGNMQTPQSAVDMQNAGGNNLFSQMVDFTQSDTGKVLGEASRQGKPMNLYPQNDMFGGEPQQMQLGNLSPGTINLLQRYIRNR